MRKNTITFENGNHAVVVTAGRDADAQTILKSLDIAQPHALIMVFGGAKGLDDSRKARLAELFTDAISPAAAELGALVIDGGTQSGVMAMMGEALARDGRGLSCSESRRPEKSRTRGSEPCKHRRSRAARTESLPFCFGGER